MIIDTKPAMTAVLRGANFIVLLTSRRAAIRSIVSDVMIGAKTGLAHVMGMRNNMSQSKIEDGQLSRSLSHK
jgi:hypothetical protein